MFGRSGCSVGATKPLVSTDILFRLPCGERDLYKVLPSLTLVCTESPRCKPNYPHTHTHTHRETYIYAVCFPGTRAALALRARLWRPSHTRGWKLLPGFISVSDTPRGLQPGTWCVCVVCVCVWRKMAAGKYNSSS